MKLTIIFFIALTIGLQSPLWAQNPIFYDGHGTAHDHNGNRYDSDGMGGFRNRATGERLRPAYRDTVREERTNEHRRVIGRDDWQRNVWDDD